MGALTRLREDLQDDIGSQLSSLRKDMAGLRKYLSRRSSRAYDRTQDSASEVADAVWARMLQALPLMRRQFDSAERLVRRNPTATAAAVGLVVAVLAVSLFVSRRQSAPAEEEAGQRGGDEAEERRPPRRRQPARRRAG